MFYATGVVEVKSRRDEYSEATRQALVDGAIELFAERGYAGASLDDIAAAARVTKGALYHYFAGKQALFEAAMEHLEMRADEEVVGAAAQAEDAWQAALTGIDAFVDRCCDPVYSRIVMQEGPVALGYARWKQCEEGHAYGLTESFVRALNDEGLVDPLPVETTARVAFGMLGAAGLAIADADEGDKARVAEELKTVLRRFLRGL